MAVRESGRAAEDETDSDDSNKERRPNLCDVERNEKRSENKNEHGNKERTRLAEKTTKRSTEQTDVSGKVGKRRRGRQPTSSPEGDGYSQHLSVISIDDHYEQGKHRLTPTAGCIQNTENHP